MSTNGRDSNREEMTMSPQHHLDESCSQQSPRSVSGITAMEQNSYQFVVSKNGSVEVEIIEMIPDAVPDETTTHSTPTCSLRNGICATPSRNNVISTSRFLSPTNMTNVTGNGALSTSPSRVALEDVASRAHKLMECVQKMGVDSQKEDNLFSAAKVGIESILNAMRLHQTKDRVQRYGCGVLEKLACQNDTYKELIVDAGGVDAILTAMKNHLASAAVQDCGCLALSNLCKTEKGSALVVQNNGIEAILDGMKVHKEIVAVQKNGCLALLSIACSHPDYNYRVAQAGGIHYVKAAIECHRTDPGIREFGSAVLWSLAYMNTKNRAAIDAAGGIDAVLSNVLGCHDDDDVDEDVPPLVGSPKEDQCVPEMLQRRISDKKEAGLPDESLASEKVSGSVDAIMSVFVRPLQ